MTDYTYDTHGRLETVKEDGAEKAHYVYDDNGNRLNDGHLETDGTYDAQDRIKSYNLHQFTYTANGALQQRTGLGGTTLYTYDALGNLRSATLPSGDVMTYVVDGLGRRVGTQKNGVWTQRLLYRSQLQPVAELDTNGAVATRYVYSSGRNVPDYAVRGGKLYSIITDHQGSVRLVVDVASNTIKQRMDYDAYGRVTEYIAPSWQPLPFGFAGGLYDRDTGLVRFGARDYDAETGRWTGKDPILFGGGDANVFGYVVGDPVNAMDPEGLWVPPSSVVWAARAYRSGVSLSVGGGLAAGFGEGDGVDYSLGVYASGRSVRPFVSLGSGPALVPLVSYGYGLQACYAWDAEAFWGTAQEIQVNAPVCGGTVMYSDAGEPYGICFGMGPSVGVDAHLYQTDTRSIF